MNNFSVSISSVHTNTYSYKLRAVNHMTIKHRAINQ